MHSLFLTAPATQARENEPGAILKDRTLESGRLRLRPSFFPQGQWSARNTDVRKSHSEGERLSPVGSDYHARSTTPEE